MTNYFLKKDNAIYVRLKKEKKLIPPTRTTKTPPPPRLKLENLI